MSNANKVDNRAAGCQGRSYTWRQVRLKQGELQGHKGTGGSCMQRLCNPSNHIYKLNVRGCPLYGG